MLEKWANLSTHKTSVISHNYVSNISPYLWHHLPNYRQYILSTVTLPTWSLFSLNVLSDIFAFIGNLIKIQYNLWRIYRGVTAKTEKVFLYVYTLAPFWSPQTILTSRKIHLPIIYLFVNACRLRSPINDEYINHIKIADVCFSKKNKYNIYF